MQSVEVNDIELDYEVVGTGEPVLLISNVIADALVPMLSEPALSHRYQLIRYHKRGWAESTHTPPPVTIADHAADAAGLLDVLDIPRAHVAGHSSGAAVAAQLALDYPERVQTLVLLELSLLSLPEGQDLLQQAQPAFDAYAADDRERAVALFLSAVSGLDWRACRNLLESRVPGVVAQTIADADTFFGIELPAVAGWSLTAEQAATVLQPVLSIVGADTLPLWFAVDDFLQASLPHVDRCVIDDVGHLLQLERAEPVARAMAEFLARHPIEELELQTSAHA